MSQARIFALACFLLPAATAFEPFGVGVFRYCVVRVINLRGGHYESTEIAPFGSGASLLLLVVTFNSPRQRCIELIKAFLEAISVYDYLVVLILKIPVVLERFAEVTSEGHDLSLVSRSYLLQG